jgi:hypothetical protein
MRARALACPLDGFGGRCRTAVRCSSGCTCGGWRCCTRSSCSGPQRTTSSFWPQSSERTLLCPAYRICRTLFVPHVPPELPYRPRTVASSSVLQPLFHSTQPALDHPTLAGSASVSSARLRLLLRPARAHICTRTRPLRRSHVCAGTRPHLRRDLQVRTAAGGAAHPQQHAHAAAVARWVRGLQPPECARERGSWPERRPTGICRRIRLPHAVRANRSALGAAAGIARRPRAAGGRCSGTCCSRSSSTRTGCR